MAAAVSLRSATGGSVAGFREVSTRALGKLEQALPPRLRGRVRAIESATVTISEEDVPTGEGETLALLATACQGRRALRLDYVGHDGAAPYRRTEPVRIVS